MSEQAITIGAKGAIAAARCLASNETGAITMQAAKELELPRCPEASHGQMALQRPGTREQEFCGTWYRCTRCTNSVLLVSPELAAQLEEQAA